jgi:uncharacterized protein YodC (DUF2158 family)
MGKTSTNLAIGTFVTLKTGGPTMIVNRRTGSTRVECVWFDNCTPHSFIFSEAALSIFEPWKDNKDTAHDENEEARQ